jgi:uncharacterized protein (UPF0335 family)
MAEARLRDSQGEVPGPGPAARPGHNGLGEAAKGYIKRIEALLGDLEDEKESYQERAEEIREDIKLVYAEAQHDGVPVKELKAAVKARKLERRAASVRDGLGMSERETFDQIRHALGDLADTPLGGAVLERASM